MPGYIPPNPNGRAAAVNSAPHVLSTEDKAVLDSIAATNADVSTNTSTSLTVLNDLAASSSNVEVGIGNTSETVAATDTANSGLNGLLKRALQRLTILITNLGTPLQAGGTVTANLGTLNGAATEATLSQMATDLHYGQGASSTSVRGPMVQGVANSTPPSPGDGTLSPPSMNSRGAQRVVLMNGTNEITAFTTVINDTRGSHTALSVTNLAGLTSSPTNGWQSARVALATALDYDILVKLTMQAGAPANDKAAYVYLCPWYYDGTNWYAASQGTATLPSGTEGTTVIASPNNLRLLGVLSYTTTTMVLQDTFLASNCFGSSMPDGFSIIIVNYSGATTSATAANNVVAYKTINRTNV